MSLKEFAKRSARAPFAIVSDASDEFGMGGFFGRVLAWQWTNAEVDLCLKELHFSKETEFPIAYRELLASLVTEVLVSRKLCGKRVLVLLDNTNAVSWRNKLRVGIRR